jgi:translocation and assembly module TamB
VTTKAKSTGAGVKGRRVRQVTRASGKALLWSLLIVVAVFIGLLLGVMRLLGELDQAHLRKPVCRALSLQIGLLVHYQSLNLSPFSGLELGGLRVANPPELRQHAPWLLKLDRLEVGWSLWDLLGGKISVQPMRIQGLAFKPVMDMDGRSSFDPLLARDPGEEPAPAQPDDKSPGLSKLLLRGLPELDVHEVALTDLSVQWLQVDGPRVVRRVSLSGPELQARVVASQGALDAALDLSSREGPAAIELVVHDHPGGKDERRRSARLDLKLAVSTEQAGRIDLKLNLNALQQDLSPNLPASGALAALTIAVIFDPDQGQTRVNLSGVDLLQGAVLASLALVVADDLRHGVGLRLESMEAKLDASQVLEKLGLQIPGLELDGTQVQVRAKGLALEPSSGLPSSGEFQVDARIARAQIDRKALHAKVEGLAFKLDGRVDEEARLDVKVGIQSQNLSAGTNEAALMSASSSSSSGQLLSAGASAQVTGLDLSLDIDHLRVNPAHPLASQANLKLVGSLAALHAHQSGQRIRLSDLGLELVSVMSGKPPLAFELKLPVGAVELTAPGLGTTRMKGIALGLRVKQLHPNWAQPAQVELGLGVASTKLTGPGRRIRADGMRLEVDARIIDPQHLSADIRLPVQRLDVALGKDLKLALRKLTLGIEITDALLPSADPSRADARLALHTRIGKLNGRLAQLQLSGQALGVKLDATLAAGQPRGLRSQIGVGQLRIARGPKGPRLAALKKGRLNLKVDRLDLNLNRPLASRVKLRMDGHFQQVGLNPGTDFGLPKLLLQVETRGRHHLSAGLDLHLNPEQIEGRKLGVQPILSLRTQANLVDPSAKLELNLKAEGGPQLNLDAQAAFVRRSTNLKWQLSAKAERLGLLDKLLPADLTASLGLDLSGLRLDLQTSGQARGLIDRFDGPKPLMAKRPERSAVGEAQLRLDLTGLSLQRKGLGLVAPTVQLKLSGKRSSEKMHADLHLTGPRLNLKTGDQAIALQGLDQRIRIDGHSQPEAGQVRLDWTTQLGRVEQNLIAGYPVADARLTLKASVDRLASVRLDAMELDNPAGGTHFELSAAVDRLQQLLSHLPAGRIPGRQALSLSGVLTQSLDRVRVLGENSQLSGRVKVPFQVESGDLKAFRVTARVEAQNVNLDLPEAGISLKGLRGRIPLVEDLARAADGSLRLLAGPPGNPYSRARFVDVHPFLRGDHFLSVDQVQVLGETIGPLAGNLRMHWGSLAIEQLQLAYRGGKISGQLAADYGGPSPRLHFKGNVTGLRPSQSKDVLDANATLDFSPDPLALAGRVQIVRIGRQHLLDLLDRLDPYQENLEVNRARLGLKVGYPKFLRLRMRDGFLSVKLELGGVAGVVRIDEIRGIALGPLLQRYVAPTLAKGGKSP